MKFLFCLFFLFSFFMANAHEIRPAYLQMTENADSSIDILWKQPVMGNYALPLHPRISAGWMDDSTGIRSYSQTYLVRQWHISPGHAPLAGQTISIQGLEKTITDALVMIIYVNGHTESFLLKSSKPSVKLGALHKQSMAVQQFLRLGIEHIWSGVDHLLFILALLLLVTDRKKLVFTITAFTIAHSITLALATLKIIQVSSAFAETCIALSIVFLAVELVHHYRGRDGITYQYPWLVAFIFGLMHGLGFAGALANVGLPQQSIPLSLFLFNVGVEIGQLVFVFLVLAIMGLMHQFIHHRQKTLRWIPVYAIGSIAAFWFIERFMNMVSSIGN